MPVIRIALCQINTIVGDLPHNRDLILRTYEQAAADDCDLAVFPEMTITGYPPEDLLLKPGFVADNLAVLDDIVGNIGETAAIIGFADGIDDVFNAAAICSDRTHLSSYHKRHLPNYGVFDEKRYFAAGTDAFVLHEFAGVRVGMSICEDLWIAGGPATQFGTGGAELIVNINGSPFYSDKVRVREEVLRRRVEEAGCPIVYVNLVGGQDELVFDGASMVVDHSGEVVARAAQFEEDLLAFDLEVPERSTDHATLPIEVVNNAPITAPAPRAARVEQLGGEIEQLHDAIVLATRDYLTKTGFGEVCLGLSGGIDSSLVAALAVSALGADNVHTIALPSRFSSDHSLTDAERVAANLGVDHRTIPIEPAHASLLDMLAPSFDGLEADVTEENVQSRVRGVVWMALANKFGWLVLTTGNKSELAVGYSTLYGDTAGAYAPISDVYKTRVYELARYVNKSAGREIIPETVIDKPPSAELRPDQRDDQSLPPYDVLDPLLEDYIEGDRTAGELIDMGHDADLVGRICRLVDINEFKRRQTPLGPRVSVKAFGRDRRLPIVNGYRP